MKKIFKFTHHSANEHVSPSNRAQVIWSVCVAVAMAIVALQQAMGSRRAPEQRSIATTSTVPQTLVTGKVPGSDHD